MTLSARRAADRPQNSAERSRRLSAKVVDAGRPSQAQLQSAERKTAEALALLETLQANAPVGFGFVDCDLRVVKLNESLASLVPRLWSQLEPIYRRVLDTGEAISGVEVSGTTAANPTRTQHWLASHYPVSVDDQVIGIGIVTVDVTERKNAEQINRQLAAIVEDSREAIFGADIAGILTSWNPAAARLFGYTAEEIVGLPVDVLASEQRLDEQAEIRARILAGGPTECYDTKRRRKDGSLVDVSITASPVVDAGGSVIGFSVILQDITDRLTSQRIVETSQRHLAEAQRIAEIGSFELDLKTGGLTWSVEHYRILGLDPALTPTADLFVPLVHLDDRAELDAAWKQATERGVGFDMTYRVVRPDGLQRWVHSRAVAELSDDGTVTRLAGTLHDTTGHTEAIRLQHEAVRRFEIAFEQAGIGAAIIDLHGIPIRVNAAVCTLLGRPESLLVGRDWDPYHHPDELPIGKSMLARGMLENDTYHDERRFIRPDGSVVWAAFHNVLVRDDSGKPMYHFAQLQDITAQKRIEAELAHQAVHDSLTGLANRALLADRLTHGLAGTRRRGSNLGVIFLDIDRFKDVNDALGHTAGDHLLNEVVSRIAATLRPGDTAARFGGDEFVIVCEDVTRQEIITIGDRLLASISHPCEIGGQEVTVTASLGIVLADAQASAESLLRESDAAMYTAKSRGRSRLEFFDNTARNAATQRLHIASALRHALQRGEFAVYYQPVVDLVTGAMVSAEALLRWEHPDLGFISPAEFIPVAEQTGLITTIGSWVLEQACEELVGWQRTAPSMSVAVNLSIRQVLAPDITEIIADVLTRTQAAPASVRLELTESVFMGDADYFGQTLAKIKALGVTLSIDDFGTGFSSLSYLKDFPIDAVKIDRAFVDGLGQDPHKSALVAAILAMADALDLGVTAEGVETPEQLLILHQLKCQRAQGYYLARPMPAAALSELVAESRHWQLGEPTGSSSSWIAARTL